MVDPRIAKLAKLCVNYSVSVKPKDQVLIRGSELSFLLLKEIYKECLVNGAHPMVMPALDLDYTFYDHANEDQLNHVSPFTKFLVENLDVSISVWCPHNPKGLTNVDPEKIRMHRAARRELAEIFNARAASGELRWVGLPYPTTAQAQEASMSLSEYENFVYRSCFADKDEPIEEWKKVDREQTKLCEYLTSAKTLHIVGPDTDLTMNVEGRKWENCSGKYNLPDGEIFTAPIEDSANGSIRFTYPGIYAGREVEDITLTFKEGKVVDASAKRGNDLLQQILEIDGADRIGEIAIGTNYGITTFTKSILFDEKIGGTLHLALGSSYPEVGGKNKSAIHWDILKDMNEASRISADGEVFYKNGKFLK
ncbi:MAG: aminopeptidase [Candidatus Bathyarchaeota archaeon]|nr:MAG: aminopeptidase [Candidatus Bathyarchaeota archaeon]